VLVFRLVACRLQSRNRDQDITGAMNCAAAQGVVSANVCLHQFVKTGRQLALAERLLGQTGNAIIVQVECDCIAC
jgi:hypothetical protein